MKESILDRTGYSEDRLIQQLYQTTRAFAKTLNSQICFSGIYHSEWTILRLAKDQQEISQGDLTAYLHVEPAAISKTLSKLEKKGVIERHYHTDARGKYISLTKEGQLLCDSLEPVVAAHRAHALAGLTQEERQQLQILMQRIQEDVLK